MTGATPHAGLAGLLDSGAARSFPRLLRTAASRIAFLGFFALWPNLAAADPLDEAPQTLSAPSTATAQANKRAFVVTPIPLSNPAIGTGLGFAAMALYGGSSAGRPWITGAGGFYTDSGSWAAGIFQRAHIAHDRFRLSAGGGYGDFHIDYFGIGSDAGDRGVSIALEEEGGAAQADLLMRVRPDLYLGVRYRGVYVNTSIDRENPIFPDLNPPQIELESISSALGLAAEYDTRDSELNPRRGLFSGFQWIYADEAFGSDFNYPRATFALNGYHGFDDKTVLAWRTSFCWSGDGAPFYDLCNYGSNNDLRGYSSGRYRDHAMAAAQVELRRHLFWRLGAVAFAGVGEVAPEFNQFDSDHVLPAAGVGLRFEASREYRVNLSIDYAVGDNGNDGLYFYVGEAF